MTTLLTLPFQPTGALAVLEGEDLPHRTKLDLQLLFVRHSLRVLLMPREEPSLTGTIGILVTLADVLRTLLGLQSTQEALESAGEPLAQQLAESLAAVARDLAAARAEVLGIEDD